MTYYHIILQKSIDISSCNSPEEIQEREFLIRQEERRRRRPQQAYKVVRITKRLLRL